MSKTESPLVEIDPIVRGLLPGYVARRREELGTLNDLLSEKRYEELQLIGHNLSGSGGAYGLPGLTDIGRAIEKAASGGDHEGLTRQLMSMAEYLDRVGIELE